MDLADTIIYGTLADVEQALAAGESIFEIDKYGFNPIVETAIMCKRDMADLLLRRGSPPDLRDLMGRTALHWAADNNDLALCQLLLANGADANSYSFSSQPVLVYPYLRRQQDLKKLLYQYNAQLTFAQDYINAKLIGHRFSLENKTHIVNAKGDFILVDFEGFLFEFTASLIQDSLKRFITNYAAKHLQAYSKKVNHCIRTLGIAAELMKYQQFSIKVEQHEDKITKLLQQDLLFVPIGYTGHAVSGVRWQNIYIKCDRGEYGRKNFTVTIYRMHKPHYFTAELIKKLLYTRNDEDFVHQQMNDLLGLEMIDYLPLEPQIVGNCSWANVEATIPAMMFILFLQKSNNSLQPKNIAMFKKECLDFFYQWRTWDQDRAIDECIQTFKQADPKRQATKVQLLAAIFAYRCNYGNTHELMRAQKILPILKIKKFDYILNAYIAEYTRDKNNPIGKNLLNLLDILTNY